MERLTNLLKIEYLVSGILSLNTKTRGSYLGFFPVYQVKAQEISEHHQLSLRCHEHGFTCNHVDQGATSPGTEF